MVVLARGRGRRPHPVSNSTGGGPSEVVIAGSNLDDNRTFAVDARTLWSYTPQHGVRSADLPPDALGGPAPLPLEWTIVDPKGTGVWANNGRACWTTSDKPDGSRTLRCQRGGEPMADLGSVGNVVSLAVFGGWIVVAEDEDPYADDGRGRVVAFSFPAAGR